MKFAIEKVILWPRGEFTPQAYEFKPEKVNLITGAKQTGRTSFVNIIDYVLGASDCDLPDVFNPAVDVVGVLTVTDKMRHLFVRGVPEVGKKSSNACDYREFDTAGDVVLPDSFEMQLKPEDIRWYLDRIVCGIASDLPNEDVKSGEDQAEGDDAPVMRFRDVLNFSLQDDVTISSRHCLVKGLLASGTGLIAKMKPFLPFILGIESRELVQVLNEKRKLEKEKDAKVQERIKITRALQNCLQCLEAMLVQAKTISLCSPTVQIPGWSNPDMLVKTAREVLEQNKGIIAPKLNSAELSREAQLVQEAQQKLKEIAVESQNVQSEIERLKVIDSRMKGYIAAAERTQRRLEISEWVEAFWSQRKLAYYGGPDAEERVNARVKALKDALENFGMTVTCAEKQSDYRAAFEREMKHWESRRELLVRDHAKAGEDLVRLCNEEGEARKFMAAQREAFELLGAIRNACETWEKLNGAENSLDEVTRLGSEVSKLELQAATLKADEDKREAACRKFLADSIKDRLASLFVKDDLKNFTPSFDIERFILQLSNGEVTRNFSNVGASSNYICFHVAVSCALMEQFSRRDDSPVQNFVIYDCPALEDGLDENGEPLHYAEQIIGTFNESLNDVKDRKWQPILMLQTPSDMFADDPEIHKVAHFAEGKGIIPEDWLK